MASLPAGVRDVPRNVSLTLLLAAFAGAATVFAFEPFGLALLPLATLTLLFWLWSRVVRARDAAAIGFAFGVGLLGAGASWVYIALASFGGMDQGLGVLATAGFVAYLALWPAVAGALIVRFAPADSAWRILFSAAAWTATEWLRGHVFTGFPWLAVGYATLPGSALSGFAPIGGVFLVSFATALGAAWLAAAIEAMGHGRGRMLAHATAGIAALLLAGGALREVEWTHPLGPPLDVSLVQGNVAQEVKFSGEFRPRTFALYTDLVAQSRGRLVVLPESAFPAFADEVPDEVVQRIAAIAKSRNGDVLIGMFTAEEPLPGSDEPRYYNSVVAVGTAPVQFYRKRHLVPFGETIPAKPVVGWFIRKVLAIPLADQTPGAPDQPALKVGGQRVGVNICYEDVFGNELIDVAREAGILINVTNDAWYGHSVAAWQHNQIAAMRALELGRPMLRATNTGITSSIDPRGRVTATLPWFTTGILEVSVVGHVGSTPYGRYGDMLVLAMSSMVLLYGAWRSRTARRRTP